MVNAEIDVSGKIEGKILKVENENWGRQIIHLKK